MDELFSQKHQHDDSIVALGLILAAWEEGADCGVAAELIAYAAIYAAVTDLIADFGEDPVADLLAQLSDRVRTGNFSDIGPNTAH